MSVKHGDWRTYESLIPYRDQAVAEAAVLRGRLPASARVRVRSSALLGYSVQIFVPRDPAERRDLLAAI